MVKVERTSMGLRNAMFDELDALRDGRSTPIQASANARLASAIIASVKIEIEHQKHVQSLGRNPKNMTKPTATLQLGG